MKKRMRLKKKMITNMFVIMCHNLLDPRDVMTSNFASWHFPEQRELLDANPSPY